jgi:hypothetical protein
MRLWRLVIVILGGSAGLLASGFSDGPTGPTIRLAHRLPTVIRQGQKVLIKGEVRGAVVVPPPCSAACTALMELQGRRGVGPWRTGSFEVLARTACCGQHQRFAITWWVPRKLALGELSLRVAAVYPTASPDRRTLAATAPSASFGGQAPVYCAPPVAPAVNIPAGDGWIVGGAYIEGGPAPGIDLCESQAYSVTALNQGGAVLASQHVAGGHSYALVVPAGTYELKAKPCGSGSATVRAGQQTRADAVCAVP